MHKRHLREGTTDTIAVRTEYWKARHAERIEENLASKHIELDSDDQEVLAKLGHKHTFRFNNPSKGWKVNLYEGLEGV